MRNMLRLVKIRFSVNSRAKTTTNRPFFLRCRWQRRLRREGIVLYTFNRLMRRSYFHLDVVYAHVQRLPPQTRTYFITNSSSSTNTHMNLYAFVVGIRAQWTSIPTNINIHTYTYIRLTTRFSFHLILVAWMLVLYSLFFAHSMCVCVCVIYNSPRQMYWCEWICFLFLLSFYRCSLELDSLLLLLLLLVVMVGLKQMKKHQIKGIHTHIRTRTRIQYTWSCERRQSRREKKSTTILPILKEKH